MPYERTRDIPPYVKKHQGSKKRQRQWMHVFNTTLAAHPGDEARAFAAANSVVLDKRGNRFGKGKPVSSTSKSVVQLANSLSGGGKAFFTYKDANGRLRFLGISSNNYKDREDETFTAAAHREFIQWADTLGSYPELWLWHAKGSKFGQVDWMDFANDSLTVVSGLIDKGKEELATRLASLTGPLAGAMSHGFVGKYNKEGDWLRYRDWEVSWLPAFAAANFGTAFDLASLKEIDMPFTELKRAVLVEKLGIPEAQIKDWESQTDAFAKELAALGIDQKALERSGVKADEYTHHTVEDISGDEEEVGSDVNDDQDDKDEGIGPKKRKRPDGGVDSGELYHKELTATTTSTGAGTTSLESIILGNAKESMTQSGGTHIDAAHVTLKKGAGSATDDDGDDKEPDDDEDDKAEKKELRYVAKHTKEYAEWLMWLREPEVAAAAKAELTGGKRSDLPDSAFAYVEPGHKKGGKTPDKFRHFPVHDASHVRNALARLSGSQSPFAAKARSRVLAAARRHGIGKSGGKSVVDSKAIVFPGADVFMAGVKELTTVVHSMKEMVEKSERSSRKAMKMAKKALELQSRSLDEAIAATFAPRANLGGGFHASESGDNVLSKKEQKEVEAMNGMADKDVQFFHSMVSGSMRSAEVLPQLQVNPEQATRMALSGGNSNNGKGGK